MTLELAVAILAVSVTIIGGLGSVATAVFAWVIRRNEKLQDDALAALKEQVMNLDTDVSGLKAAVARYEPLVGAGQKGLDDIHRELKDHIDREERTTAEQQRSSEAVLQRLSTIEARMPNGELKDLVRAVSRIEATLEGMKVETARVVRHVEEHEADSEGWKQRIVVLEAKAQVQVAQ